MKTQPYICRVQIKNFRNFRSVDFRLNKRQVVIGENGVGKSNLLRALQLILDPTLSEKDRALEESDFWAGLDAPMENGEEIEISMYLSDYEDNLDLLAQLVDATVMLDGGQEALKLTYRFYPDENGDYRFIVFKGDDETRPFTYEDRKVLNIKVIKAIRDVEAEMRSPRTSPLTQVLKQKYAPSKEALTDIAQRLDSTGRSVLQVDQIQSLENCLKERINAILASDRNGFDVSLRTTNADASKLLYALRPLIDGRETYDASLGVDNVLYVALVLLQLQDSTVPPFLDVDKYERLARKNQELATRFYRKTAANDYELQGDEMSDGYPDLYRVMSETFGSNGVTILAVEEPEAHLHPIYQRLLYKHFIKDCKAPVITTTHSTHISAVADVKSIVRLLETSNGTDVKTTADLNLESRELDDLARYIDVNRGEVYMAKGVVFVEGYAEEYLLPRFAEGLGFELDRFGVVVCNIASTNFKPYWRFAQALGLPCVAITDGDPDPGFPQAFLGLIRAFKLCESSFQEEEWEAYTFSISTSKQRALLAQYDFFVGETTFETDIFAANTTEQKQKIILQVFNELTEGRERQQENFARELALGEYDACLRKIENGNGIGKGRFAQRLATYARQLTPPEYIRLALLQIKAKVAKTKVEVQR